MFFNECSVTTMLVIGVLGGLEGVILTTSVLRWGQTSWVHLGLAVAGAVGGVFLCQYQTRRIDHYERERKKWRKGAVGECMVADLLGALSDDYSVINGVTTNSGDLDHIVVGPTGVFAIETKNWRGTVAADDDGELVLNGKSTPTINQLGRRMMGVREQVITLTRQSELFIKAVIVFPRARVDARFGDTLYVDCLTDESLCNYIENAKRPRRLTPREVDQIARAFKGIAEMDPGFATTSTAAVNRSKSESTVVASTVPNRT